MNVSVDGHARKRRDRREGENRGRRARAARFRCLVQSSLTDAYIQRNNKKKKERKRERNDKNVIWVEL